MFTLPQLCWENVNDMESNIGVNLKKNVIKFHCQFLSTAKQIKYLEVGCEHMHVYNSMILMPSVGFYIIRVFLDRL